MCCRNGSPRDAQRTRRAPASRVAGNFHLRPQPANERISLLSANLLPFMFANIELWLHKPPTAQKRAKDERTKVKSEGGNFLLYLFFLKLNFPFRNTRNFGTSLGILRVKPEVFHFSGRFLFTAKRPLPSEKMIKSIGGRKVARRIEKSNIYR